MGRNHEVTTVHPLLDENGQLTEPGWSRSLLQTYDRNMIKAPKWRIKEIHVKDMMCFAERVHNRY